MDDEIVLKNIAENLRRKQQELELSHSELARRCSTNNWRCYPANISQIACGDHMPGAGLLARIAAEVGMSMDDMVKSPRHRKARKRSNQVAA